MNSHEHSDHGGCLATIKQRSRARMVAIAAARPYLEYPVKVVHSDGRASYGWEPQMAVAVDRVIGDGDTVSVGGVTLTAHSPPLHTAGATTWTMTVMEQGTPYQVVFESGLSLDEPNSDFQKIERIYAKLRALKAHVFFCGHPRKCGFARMHPDNANLKEEYQRQKPAVRTIDTRVNPLVDPTGAEWLAYLNKNEQEGREFFAKYLAERDKKPPRARLVVDSTSRIPIP